MSPVHRLSQMGSMTTNKIDYPSMLAGYGDFGALTRIQYQVLGSTTNNIIFSNIPQTFQDLRLVLSLRGNSAATTDNIWFYASPYATDTSGTNLTGNGSSATSTRETSVNQLVIGTAPSANATSGIFGSTTVDILNYANTSTFKTFIVRNACDLNGSGNTNLTVGLKRNTGAISTLVIFPQNSTFWAAGSTAALYGVRASAS